MNRSYLLSLLLSALTFSSSCCKKDPIEPEKFLIPKDVVDYIHYDLGSWWKYMEVTSGEIDSVYVTESKFYYASDLPYQFESLDNMLRDEVVESGLYFDFDEGDPRPPTRYIVEAANDNVYGYSFFYCTNPCDTNPIIPFPEGLSTRANIDTLTVQGDVYSDIIHVININTFTHTHINEVWYARHVGVIKRKFFDGTTWELVEHHSTQSY